MNDIKKQLQELYTQKELIQQKIDHLESVLKQNSSYRFTLKDAIYINTSNLTKDIFDQLKALATFDNPQIKLMLGVKKTGIRNAQKNLRFLNIKTIY